MALSNKTYNKLADALLPEVIEYIFEDERWVNFMQEIIPDAITNKMGNVDPDVLYDLSLCVMDKIAFKTGTL
jgi:hypothetical protein